MTRAAILALILMAGPAIAHDQYHDWKIPGTTTICCNDKDCGPIRARQAIKHSLIAAGR